MTYLPLERNNERGKTKRKIDRWTERETEGGGRSRDIMATISEAFLKNRNSTFPDTSREKNFVAVIKT